MDQGHGRRNELDDYWTTFGFVKQNISINKTPGSSKENRHNDSEDYCPYEFTDTSSPIDNYIRLISKELVQDLL